MQSLGYSPSDAKSEESNSEDKCPIEANVLQPDKFSNSTAG